MPDGIWAGFWGLFYRKFFWDFVGGTLRDPGGIQYVTSSLPTNNKEPDDVYSIVLPFRSVLNIHVMTEIGLHPVLHHSFPSLLRSRLFKS